jgi:Zn-dependent M16 (insulinase) family peptidase
MPVEQLALLPYYTNVLTELGLGDSDYLETQHRQSASVGAINAFTSMRGEVDDEQAITAKLVLSSKALLRNSDQQTALMVDTLHNVRFNEHARIRDMISHLRARREQSVTGNGHGLAMAAACAGMSPLAQLNHELSGLAGIRTVRRLDESIRDDASLEGLAAQLESLHNAITDMPVQLLAVAEPDEVDAVANAALGGWSALDTGPGGDPWRPAALRETRNELWVTNTQVNFCARAYPTVPVGHPDAAALTVLGAFLRNGYLHRAIREQGGAYGGGASQDSGIAAFRFYSYRDPRLWETLDDFDASIRWLGEEPPEQRQLEEAILGIIGSLDKPSSPAGEAKQHFHNRLFGRTHDQREVFRQQVLSVSADDLRRVAETYLTPENASTAVITSAARRDADSTRIEEQRLAVETL